MTDYDWLLEAQRKLFDADMAAAANEADVRAVRDKHLSRHNGLITALMKTVAGAPAEKRTGLGRAANALKQYADSQIKERLSELTALARARQQQRNAIDVTLPGRRPLTGHRHPLTLM